jgi:hypothetical protein
MHDPAGRRVPASLPAPSTPTRLRPHPQLRLPCQPTTCPAAATLPQLASGRKKHPSCIRIAFNRPPSLTVEVSRVRRNHACPRSALSSSTPAPFPAIRWGRLMNAQLHPRTLLVSAHAYSPCASSDSDHSASRPQARCRLLRTILVCGTLPQYRHTQFITPSAKITRSRSAPLKAHSTGSR